MSMGTTLRFDLPQSWTVRKVATALAREWLSPFRAEPVVKFNSARWLVQPIVEDPGEREHPLWERGISTEEFQKRMDREDLGWAVRASFGRGRATVLARLIISKDQTSTFQIACTDATFPDSLFNPEKLDEFLAAQGTTGSEGLFTALLADNGFQRVAL